VVEPRAIQINRQDDPDLRQESSEPMATVAATAVPRPTGLQKVFGLALSSPFALPGAGPIRTSHADLTITSGEAKLPAGFETRGPYRRIGGQLELTIPAAGRFLLRARGRLEVALNPGVEPDVLGAFLVASGLPMLLWQRGGLLLHASGLTIGDTAIALCGPSGVGKSSLARALIDRGAGLLGDDTLWFPDPGEPAFAHGIGGGQFLRDAPGREAVFHPVPADRQSGPAQLGALFILSRDAAQLEPLRLGAVAATQAILRNRHRPLVPALLDRDGAVLVHCTRLAAQIPVFHLGLEEGNLTAAMDALISVCAVPGSTKPAPSR
jgi:hypothetical protein